MSNFALGPLGGSSGVETSLLRDLIAELTSSLSAKEGEAQGIRLALGVLQGRLYALNDDNERAFQEILGRGGKRTDAQS